MTLQHDDPFEALVRGTRAETLPGAPANDEQLLVSVVLDLCHKETGSTTKKRKRMFCFAMAVVLGLVLGLVGLRLVIVTSQSLSVCLSLVFDLVQFVSSYVVQTLW